MEFLKIGMFTSRVDKSDYILSDFLNKKKIVSK